jgi:hypothetical protein
MTCADMHSDLPTSTTVNILGHNLTDQQVVIWKYVEEIARLVQRLGYGLDG